MCPAPLDHATARFHAWLRVASAAALLMACVVYTAQAQVPKLDRSTWVVNGGISSIVPMGNTIYIGGGFSYVGPNTGLFAAMDTHTGITQEGWPFVAGQYWGFGSIDCLEPDGSGGWYIAGNFTSVGGVPRNHLAHLRADKSLDPWNPDPGASGYVYSMAVSGSVVYVGGSFASIGGQPRSNLAALDASTGLATAWNPGADGSVHALEPSGSLIYVGGEFMNVGGQSRQKLAALEVTTGLATAWNPEPASWPYSPLISTIAVGPSAVYVGGWFNYIGGQTRANVAALDATTGLAKPGVSGADGSVIALALDGPRLYVGGQFSNAGGQSRNNLAAFDVTTGLVTGWNPGPSREVTCILSNGSTVYVGGAFASIGGRPLGPLAAIDAATGLATEWDPGTSDGFVDALALDGSTLFIGGQMGSIGGVHRSGLAAIDATTGRATAWNPAPDGGISEMTRNGPNLILCGGFTHIGGLSRNHIASIDAATGIPTGWNPDADSNPTSLAISGSTVYLAGTFTRVGGQPRGGAAAVDIVTGAPTPWNPSPNGRVDHLDVSNGIVYAAGDFSRIGGRDRRGLAACDGTTGLVMDWNPDPDGLVESLACSDTIVYVGGEFMNIGGEPRSRIAAVGASGGLATTWNPGADGAITAIAPYGGTVYAGGFFSHIGGVSRGGFVVMDSANAQVDAWNPGLYGGYPLSIVRSELGVIMGGSFDGVEGEPRHSFAFFRTVTDSVPPIARLLSPNGGERVWVGQSISLSWIGTDDLGVRDVSLLLSRTGPDGPWESIAQGIENTGDHSWRVTGPATTRTYVRIDVRDLQGNVSTDIGDAPFEIVADTTPPTVHLLGPNGHESAYIGQPLAITWSATDEVAVESVDLELSRGAATGPWESIAAGVPNTGSFAWTVTGPMAFDEAWVRVTARDYGGNGSSDISDQAFTILEPAVPTLVEMFRAVPVEAGVRIEWQLSDANAFRSVALERAAAVDGEWGRVPAEAVVEGRRTHVLDTGVRVGQTAWYRLNAVDRDARAFTFGPISAQAGEVITSFALSPPSPNPTADRSLVSFAVPERASVRLSLVDVQGRERAVLADGVREPGRWAAALDVADLPAGIYFLRMQSRGVVLTRRIAIVR